MGRLMIANKARLFGIYDEFVAHQLKYYSGDNRAVR